MSDTDHIRELREPNPAEATAKPEKKPEDARSFAWFLVKLVLIVLLFRTLVFTSFNIPSESMMPRLLVGDYLFAAKWPYGYSRYSLPFDLDVGDGRLLSTLPERGDVAIFKHPIDKSDYIKRVIGLPGDTIQMMGGVLYINGTAVTKEPVANFVLPTSAARGCGPQRPCGRLRQETGRGNSGGWWSW